jgi:peptide-methionine (R)-S-oxide reductase
MSINEGSVKEESDKDYGMIRTEIICAKYGAHSGHVFDGGPEPTGLHHCIKFSFSIKGQE